MKAYAIELKYDDKIVDIPCADKESIVTVFTTTCDKWDCLITDRDMNVFIHNLDNVIEHDSAELFSCADCEIYIRSISKHYY